MNKTSKTVNEIRKWKKAIEENHSVEEAYDLIRFELPLILKKYVKMENRLKSLAESGCRNKKCSCCSTVTLRCEDALKFDPLHE